MFHTAWYLTLDTQLTFSAPTVVRMLRSFLDQGRFALNESEPVRLLAIDTSADRAGVALLLDGELHETSWPAARSQTTQVLPRIQELLGGVGISTADLNAVSVAIGPGTFTGLRVGASLAKGLAMAHGMPIVGIPTLAATALPWLVARVPVIAVLPAGRGRLVWQRYRPTALADDETSAPVNGTPDELLEVVERSEAQVIAGELPVALEEALQAAPVPVVAAAGMTSRVGAVALLGQQRVRQGDLDDLAALAPIYVHGTPKASRAVLDELR